MTPGTRPSRRTARAAPLPARGRAVALISLTVAIVGSSFHAMDAHPTRRLASPCFQVMSMREPSRTEPAAGAANLQGCSGAAMAGLIASVATDDNNAIPPETG